MNIPQYATGATAFTGLSDVSSASLTVDKFYLPAITKLTVTASGSSAYLFDQYSGNNPTIYAISGTTIAFDLGTGALSSHPFLIRFSGANYDTGLTHVTSAGVVTTGSSAQGKTSGTLYWKIPSGISGTYGYLCSNHGTMIGVITINPETVTATSLSLGSVTNESKATMFTSPTFTGTATLQTVTEVLNTKTGATGVVAHDYGTGSTWYHSSIAANFTANITNAPTTDNRSIVINLILIQGATAYIPSALQVGGSALTIKWVNGVTPTGNPNKVDIATFTLIRTGAAWAQVLGTYGSFG